MWERECVLPTCSKVSYTDLVLSDISQTCLGRSYNRLAFYYSQCALCGGQKMLTVDEAKQKALQAVEMAIAIFAEVGYLLCDSANNGTCGLHMTCLEWQTDCNVTL